VSLGDYRYTGSFGTRWNDNDVYGHVNNAVYYAAMDTVINRWLIEVAGLDIAAGESLAVCAASSCEFSASAAYPDALMLGLRAERVGTSSITWNLGIHRAGDELLLATGRFVHVFVERQSRRPTPIPQSVLDAVREQL
jgi:acyl-CoA thioester hydrolase